MREYGVIRISDAYLANAGSSVRPEAVAAGWCLRYGGRVVGPAVYLRSTGEYVVPVDHPAVPPRPEGGVRITLAFLRVRGVACATGSAPRLLAIEAGE